MLYEVITEIERAWINVFKPGAGLLQHAVGAPADVLEEPLVEPGKADQNVAAVFGGGENHVGAAAERLIRVSQMVNRERRAIASNEHHACVLSQGGSCRSRHAGAEITVCLRLQLSPVAAAAKPEKVVVTIRVAIELDRPDMRFASDRE